MNRALFAATVVSAALIGVTTFAQDSKPQAPPMTPILAGKKIVPPIRGAADVDYMKEPTRREGTTLVTKIHVKNTSTAPIARLKVTETWYDKKNAELPGGEGVINGLLQPGEVQVIEIRTPTNPNFNVQMLQFTHANGTVPKPHAVKSFGGDAKEPAAKPAAAAKKK
jgi:hypothetical protein